MGAQQSLVVCVVWMLLVGGSGNVSACPMCADAVTTQTAVGGDTIGAVQGRSRGFFYSICGMVSVPFIAVGGVALALRREARLAG